MPFVCSAIRFRARRSFSYVKYAHSPAQVAMKRTPAVRLNGCTRSQLVAKHAILLASNSHAQESVKRTPPLFLALI